MMHTGKMFIRNNNIDAYLRGVFQGEMNAIIIKLKLVHIKDAGNR
jgi:hypothetical protein